MLWIKHFKKNDWRCHRTNQIRQKLGESWTVKERNYTRWDLSLYGFSPEETFQSTQYRDIRNWSRKPWFYWFKGQSAGFRDAKAAEKCEDNSRKTKTTGERTAKSEHKHHSISCLNTYLCRCKVDFMCKVDFKDSSKKQQLEDKTTTSWEKISSVAPFKREYGFVSSQDYCFLKQTNKNWHFF